MAPTEVAVVGVGYGVRETPDGYGGAMSAARRAGDARKAVVVSVDRAIGGRNPGPARTA